MKKLSLLTTQVKKIIKQHNEQLYANKVDIQMKWAHSLERQNKLM